MCVNQISSSIRLVAIWNLRGWLVPKTQERYKFQTNGHTEKSCCELFQNMFETLTTTLLGKPSRKSLKVSGFVIEISKDIAAMTMSPNRVGNGF